MKGNKYIIAVFVLILVSFSALAIEINKGEESVSICPRSTSLFIDIVKNNEDTAKDYTINADGEASSWATSIPTGFRLNPGETKAIYTYVTPFSTTLPKLYNLNVKVSTPDSFQVASHTVNVKDCHILNTGGELVKEICPGESATFEINVQNMGEYQEIYSLYPEGEIADKVKLSKNLLKLDPGQSEIILAYVQTSPEDLGEYGFSVTADSQVSDAISTITAKVNVKSCFVYDVMTETDYVEFCEHTKQTIPIKIDNKGSIPNSYELKLDGPLWASLSKSKLDISANNYDVSELILTPDYGVKGGFDINIEISPNKGGVTAKHSFKANVKQCHSLLVDIQAERDKLCNSVSNNYNVVVKNTGEVSKQLLIGIDGPVWVSLDTLEQFTLDVGQEKTITMTVNPDYNVQPGDYDITIRAKSMDDSQTTAEDKITITTVAREQCYQPKITLETNDIEVYYDGSATVPATIENTGSYKSVYELAMSDTASSFVQLNPSTVEIEAGDSEVVYIYIAPNSQVDQGKYLATLSAKLQDSTILASADLDIEVTNVKPKEVIDSENKISWWEKITGWFVRLFDWSKSTVNETQEENVSDISTLINGTTGLEGITGETGNEVVEEVQNENVEEPVVEENITEIINDTEVIDDGLGEEVQNETVEEPVVEKDVTCQENGVDSLDLVDSLKKLINKDDTYEFIINGENHNIKIDAVDESSIFLTISSDPQQLLVNIGQTKEVDLNNDGKFDLKVTYNGLGENGAADVTFEKIKPVEESATIGILKKIKEYENYIIVGIIILALLIIIIKTKFHKKVMNFFEEDIEEENITEEKVEEKKEEGEQQFSSYIEKSEEEKEEPKKEKKTRKKKEENDKT